MSPSRSEYARERANDRTIRWQCAFLERVARSLRTVDTILGLRSSKPSDEESLGFERGIDVDPDEPDATMGPILPRGDAPEWFSALDKSEFRTGGLPPDEVRLSFLPGPQAIELLRMAPEYRRILHNCVFGLYSDRRSVFRKSLAEGHGGA